MSYVVRWPARDSNSLASTMHGPLLKALLIGTRDAISTAPGRQAETGIVDQHYDFNLLCALTREFWVCCLPANNWMSRLCTERASRFSAIFSIYAIYLYNLREFQRIFLS